jgi:hypothetical protein
VRLVQPPLAVKIEGIVQKSIGFVAHPVWLENGGGAVAMARA